MNINKIDSLIQEIKRKQNVLAYYTEFLGKVKDSDSFTVTCKGEDWYPLDLSVESDHGQALQGLLYQELNEKMKAIEQELNEDVLNLRTLIATDSFGSRLCEVAALRG
jgi:hypothetical protein